MARVHIVNPNTATGPAKSLLDAVQAQLGVTPNFIRVLANSPKALEGFLGLYGALGGIALDKKMQERIALAVAEGNACQYCVSAHTAIGRGAGLSNDEMALNRAGSSADAKAAAVVAFAKAINDNMGEITAAEFDAARAAGLTDAEVVDVITVVALNVFTNILGKATQVDIDFPKVELLTKPLRAAA
ncbi:MAG: carboxymuconolactone decarboxylase family protein [Betaproteobacteria bacterium]|nr:carboxymuconolactone decarboxylase family protein [Betaproteobacteria bacterium]